MSDAPPPSSRPAGEGRAQLQRVTLPPRTMAGYLAATAAVFVILVLSYRALQSRAVGARGMSQTLEVTRHLEGVLSTLKDAETGQRGYLLTGAERYLQPYDAAVSALPLELAVLRRLLSGNEAQLRRVDALEPFVSDKMAELEQTVKLRRSDRAEAALQVVLDDRGRETMDAIRAAVTRMMEAEQLLLEARTEEWESAVAISTRVTWGGAALLLALIGVSAVLSSRDFREQRVQAWLGAGENELSVRMQGDKGVRELGESIATFLAGYLDALVGAVYFAEKSGQLSRIGGYAPSGEGERTELGLAGQVFRDNVVIHVDDVPEDYFPISSALGRAKPRHLIVAAVSADGRSNGVIELGFFHGVRDRDLELLRRVAEPIGVALRSSRYRRDLQDLLEASQRQAEELQTQQEELRVQNEELEQQSRALQDSQTRLQNQQAELEQINSQLEEQTHALERQRDDLVSTQRDLQRASVYKSEFLANMSHELRTPLNSSLILAKLLLDNREGNMSAEQVKFAQTIYSAGNELLTLINDILDLSKIEAGKLDVRPENVSLPRLVDELRNTFDPVARDKHLELAVTLEDGSSSIYTDPTRLQQILKNLLSNGLKFTERGGVYLDVRRARDGRLVFEVKDTGIGIPAERHEVVFEAFRQADGTTNRKFGGTGLGLSISRDLAKLLGGELRLASAPGRGSTFTLLLRDYDGSREEARSPALPSPVHRSQSAPLPTSPRPRRDPAKTPDDRDAIRSEARVILVIEDDVRFARIIYDMAHELDFQALIAENAEDGLELAKRYRPSAIVLDVGLPDRSGLSVLDALKHDPATRHIPVHMASVADYAQAALSMGAAGYAIKPVKREQLASALKRLEAKFTQKLRRVLVVEDDDVHRESTCRLLAADDVETVPVATAEQALERLGASTFDCMVLDLTLPDRTGFDLLEEMSQKEQYSFPPVIVYTGRSLSREEEQQLRRFSSSIIIKGARSPERLLDEVTLFLHQVESKLPLDRQRMIRDARHRESIFEGRRILLVEDDVRNIFALSSVLEPKGAKVEIARNGREALTHLEQHPGVDLVLMDIMMPEMDGLQAMREIRKDPQYAKLPIIALTAKAMPDDRDQCLAAGANDYVAKPVDIDKLLSLARVWMSS